MIWSPTLNFWSSFFAHLLCESATLSSSMPRTERWKPEGFLGRVRPRGRFSAFALASRISTWQLRMTFTFTCLDILNSLSSATGLPRVSFTDTMWSHFLSCSSCPTVSLYARKGPGFTSVTKSESLSCVSRSKPQMSYGFRGTSIATSMGGPGGRSTPGSLILSRRKASPRPASFSFTSLLKPFSIKSEAGKKTWPRVSELTKSSS
mmetsp:Transcript_14699/g.46234  ORF Transcript_14699/g.46234 Transcript_14699/m.46234 type:complete len:206 (+) Transcript_14699:502-1119(+)